MRWRDFTRPSKAVWYEAARQLDKPTRRLFLKRAGVGTLAAITGVALSTDRGEKALKSMSLFNDRVQPGCSIPNMARTFTEDDITRPFPFNALYEAKDAPGGRRLRACRQRITETKRPWKIGETRAGGRKRRSRSTSASKAGAPSANGAGSRFATC
jgi:hypothetical protein